MLLACALREDDWGRVRVTGQTSNFSCDEPNTKERNLLFSLASINFFTCEVRRLSA